MALVRGAGADWPILAQAPLNAIVTLLIAEGILLIPKVRSLLSAGIEGEAKPFNEYLLAGFLTALVLPLVILNSLHGRNLEHTRRAEIEIQMTQAGRALAQVIDEYLLNHRSAVEMLAAAASRCKFDPKETGVLLAEYRRSYPGFVTLLAADRDGYVISASPLKTQSGKDYLALRPRVHDRAGASGSR